MFPTTTGDDLGDGRLRGGGHYATAGEGTDSGFCGEGDDAGDATHRDDRILTRVPAPAGGRRGAATGGTATSAERQQRRETPRREPRPRAAEREGVSAVQAISPASATGRRALGG